MSRHGAGCPHRAFGHPGTRPGRTILRSTSIFARLLGGTDSPVMLQNPLHRDTFPVQNALGGCEKIPHLVCTTIRPPWLLLKPLQVLNPVTLS